MKEQKSRNATNYIFAIIMFAIVGIIIWQTSDIVFNPQKYEGSSCPSYAVDCCNGNPCDFNYPWMQWQFIAILITVALILLVASIFIPRFYPQIEQEVIK